MITGERSLSSGSFPLRRSEAIFFAAAEAFRTRTSTLPCTDTNNFLAALGNRRVASSVIARGYWWSSALANSRAFSAMKGRL